MINHVADRENMPPVTRFRSHGPARSASGKQTRPTFVLELRPEPGCQDPVRALRAALKTLLRRFHLRALSVEERKAMS